MRREPFASHSPSFLLARKKKGKKEEPGAAFPFQCLAVPGCPCGAPGPQQSSGGGRGGALPQVLRTPCSRVFPPGTGGSPGPMQWPCCSWGAWSSTPGRDGSAGVLAGSPAATASATAPCGCPAAYSQETRPYFTQRQRNGKTCPASEVTFEEIAKKKLTGF